MAGSAKGLTNDLETVDRVAKQRGQPVRSDVHQLDYKGSYIAHRGEVLPFKDRLQRVEEAA